jgi:hypothetical protein
MNTVVQTTETFREHLARLSSTDQARVKQSVKRLADLFMSNRQAFYQRVTRPMAPKLKGGFHSSLYVARAGLSDRSQSLFSVTKKINTSRFQPHNWTSSLLARAFNAETIRFPDQLPPGRRTTGLDSVTCTAVSNVTGSNAEGQRLWNMVY